ncbi:hypothetical protein DFH28DRAFT_1119580 [Melampsora americana]|nr:hypothetical protein DFH28DRAFT_1119580 [Melampsora americana]
MHLFRFLSVWVLFHSLVFSASIGPLEPIPEVIDEAQQTVRLSKQTLPSEEHLKELHDENQKDIGSELNEFRKDQEEESNSPKRLKPESPKPKEDLNEIPPNESIPKYVEEKSLKKPWSFSRVWKSLRRGIKKFLRWFKKDITHHQYWVERIPKPIPDSEKGPWRFNGWYRHNPRPGNDDGSKELEDLRVLGNELQEDYEKRKRIWIEKDLPKHHNPKLYIEILSEKTFLELVIQYTKEYNQAKNNQENVLRIWNDLVKQFGSEPHARDVLKGIEDYYRKVFPGFRRDTFGIDFYSKMHNPLLLPTTEESKNVNWQKIFEQELIAVGDDKKTKRPKSAILLDLCHEYRGYVDLWRKAMDSGSAIKKYLNTIKDLTFEETKYPNQVLEKFRDLFPKRINIAEEGLTDDIRAKLSAEIPNMAMS